MKKLFLTLILAILWVQAAFGYTVYYDCGTCDILTPATNTSGLQAYGANSGWSYQVFGYSVQSRPIDGVIVHTTGYDQTVMIVGGVHGDDETTTTRGPYNFLSYLNANPSLYPNIRFIVIPMVNPDGRVAATRRNIGAAGNPVNLARNFPDGWGAATGCGVANAGNSSPASSEYKGPSAASEPETQAIMSAVDTYLPDVFIDCHMNSNMVIRTGVDTSSWKYTQFNIDLGLDGYPAFGSEQHCNDFGCSSTYALSLGKESFTVEAGPGGVVPGNASQNAAVNLEVNRIIATIKSHVDRRRYFNSHAIRMTASSATKIGNVTYSDGIFTAIPVAAASDSQSIEITGYKSPFVEATKTTINLDNSISTPTFGQSTTTLTGVPLTTSATSGSLDIVVNSWGPNSKSWTESATSAPTNPVHVIGGLTAGQSYRIAVSDALQTTITGAACSIVNGYNWCVADSSGNVTFTYGGTYSDHTFTLDQDSGAAAVSSITGGMMSGGRIY